MDLLYSKKVDGFCIVSSDSDFTRLATRLREAGMFVIGIGEKKTPQPFITACDKFIYIEILRKQKETDTDEKTTNKKDKQSVPNPSVSLVDRDLVKLIKESVDEISDDNGWAFLGSLGNYLIKKKTDFDPRNYGFNKLYPLIKKINKFEIEERESGEKNIRHIYIKNK